MSSRTPALPWRGHLQLLVAHPVFITSRSQDGCCGFRYFTFTSAFQGGMKVGGTWKLYSSEVLSFYLEIETLPTSFLLHLFGQSRFTCLPLTPFSQRKMGQYDGLEQTQLFTYAWNRCLLSWDECISTGWCSVTREDLEWCLLGSQQTVCESKQWNN